MKISKVDHRRTAVAKTKSSEIEGLIYKVPNNKPDNNISNVINELIKKASDLYSPIKQDAIGKLTKNKEEKEIYAQIERNIRYFVNNYVVDLNVKKDCPQIIIKSNELFKKDLNEKIEKFNKTQEKKKVKREFKVYKKMDDLNIDNYIDELTKIGVVRKLNRTVETHNIPDILNRVMKVVCREYDYDKLNEIDKTELYYLYTEIIKDRDKNNLRLKENDEKNPKIAIERSLKNQRVKTKVEGVKILPSYAKVENGNEKSNKKAYLYDFLMEFTVVDKEKREKKLIEINEIIAKYIWLEDAKNIENITPTKIPNPTNVNDSNKSFLSKKTEIVKNRGETNYSKETFNELKEQIRYDLVRHYNNVDLNKDNSKIKYWLNYFSRCIETLFVSSKKINEEYLKNEYLCRYLRKSYYSYLVGKYIDIGKGLYHFQFPNMYDVELGITRRDKISIDLSKIQNENFKNGLTSFDYEKVKAEENINRDIATSVTFAASAFSNSILKPQEDVKNLKDALGISDYSKEPLIRDDALKRVLRYFGGQSKWKDFNFNDEKDVLNQIKFCLSRIRNGSYHYTSEQKSFRGNEEFVIRKMFNKEYDKLGDVYLKKYYSNNLPFFYDDEKIVKLMSELYKDRAIRQAQIPAFNNILKRKDIESFIKSLEIKTEDSLENNEIYRSSIYFLLKEIYYYSFLQQSDLKSYFEHIYEYVEVWCGAKKPDDKKQDNCGKQCKDGTNVPSEDKSNEKVVTIKLDIKEKNPCRNFVQRVKEVENEEFSTICQTIMTDYNLQNQIKSIKQKDKEIYKHFPLILYKIIREMFLEYLKKMISDKEDIFGFIRRPNAYDNTLNLDDFIKNNNLVVNTFNELKNDVDDKQPNILDWYILGKFLTPKQNNLLIGDFRNYIQYVGDIESRFKCLNPDYENNKYNPKVEKYKKILNMLEFVQLTSGMISSEINDYFTENEDTHEYIQYLSNFIDVGTENEKDMFTKLREFESEYGLNIYSDEKNGILNKNIVYADMYGNSNLVKNSINKKIDSEYLKEYKDKKDSLEERGIFSKLTQNNKRDIEDLREFQNMKNRIELYNVSIYTDIVNDFMSQLVSWAYLRERDMMYFNLGVHYIRMSNGEIDKNENKLHFESNNGNKEYYLDISNGAILYDIVSLYTHTLPLFIYDKESKQFNFPYKEKNNKKFLTNGTGTIGDKTEWFKVSYGSEVFDCCKELLSTLAQEDKARELRNSIAHMNYISGYDKNSILDLMGKIYKDFFIYNPNLRKSVSYIFNNILEKYNMTCITEMVRKDGNNEEFKFKIIDNYVSIGLNKGYKYDADKNQFTKKVEEENKESSEKNEETKTSNNLTEEQIKIINMLDGNKPSKFIINKLNDKELEAIKTLKEDFKEYLHIKEVRGLSSTKFTFKFNIEKSDGKSGKNKIVEKQCKVDVRNDEFIEDVKNLLYFHN